MNLIFATNNDHKVTELRSAVPAGLRILTLREAGIDIEIPEPHDTLQANAEEKARTIWELTGTACFSEDSGLEIDALQGAPGVHSAHYAGDRSAEKNMERVLQELAGKPGRGAQFRTVICLLLDGETRFFEGICRGSILGEPRGNGGFGYDPIFVPEGEERCFGEMSLEEKNRYSHRRKAADELVAFLNTYCQSKNIE